MYPVPAVVVLTGVAPVTGAVTPAIVATEITVSIGAEGATATGSGGGGGVAVVIDGDVEEGSEEPAAFIAFNENV
jgi:hypothetical protein